MPPPPAKPVSSKPMSLQQAYSKQVQSKLVSSKHVQSNQVQFLAVTEDEAGQRLDNYLSSRLKGLPKSHLYRIIRKGEVRINKGRAKPDRKLVAGDMVRVPPVRTADPAAVPPPSQSLADTLGEATLYDEGGLLVINKPAGIAVHGGSGIHLGLIEAMRQLPGNHGFLELIHRLDRDTSGCIMLARKRSVLKFVQEALREKGVVQKTYYAVVVGSWPKHATLVDVPLKRFETANGERIVRVNDEGKKSLTRFRIVQRFSDMTLVEVQPLTGRTHQIRVHAKHVGHSLVGDTKYGIEDVNRIAAKAGCKRLFLHAAALKLTDKQGDTISVAAPMPSELQSYLDYLGKNKGK